jgi:uncharacterized membrane protein YqjE
MNGEVKNGRSLAAILSDMKSELQEFARTRIELLRREIREKTSALKAALPLAIAGSLLLSTAFLMLSLALAALIATAFGDNPYRWFFGCLAIAIVWAIGGASCLYAMKQRLSKQSMVPEKTVRVLSGDKLWIQNEVRKAS